MPNRNPGGRPPKFNEPSRPITVTLPERVLCQLERISPDRGEAIVKLIKHVGAEGALSPRVEIVEVSRNSGLIIVGPCPVLSKIPFLHLVEVAPARFLLAVDSAQDFSALELAIHDLLDSNTELPQVEHDFILELLSTIRHLRRNGQTSHAEILLVDLKKNC